MRCSAPRCTPRMRRAGELGKRHPLLSNGWGKQTGQELTFANWLLAWEGYAVAAAALDQLCYTSAIVHKHNVAQIACQAHAERRTEALAVIYDRLVRYAVFIALRACALPVLFVGTIGKMKVES